MPLAVEVIVIETSATCVTDTTTVRVLLPVAGSGVVEVPNAVFDTLLVPGLIVALTTRVSVLPEFKLFATAVALEPATVVVPLPPVLLALTRVKPELMTSVKVTFCAVLGPRLTNVTV